MMSRLSTFLLGTALCIATPSWASPPPDSAPASAPASSPSSSPSSPTPLVKKIEVKGNKRIETEVIRQQIHQEEGKPLNSTQIRDDIRAIYAIGEFDDVVVELEEGVMTVTVKERPLIASISFEGNKKLKKKRLEEMLTVKPGEVIDFPSLFKIAETIEDAYEQKGFPFAEVTPKASPTKDEKDGDKVAITFAIVEKSKVSVSSVKFTGNKNLSADDLEEVMIIRPRNLLSLVTPVGKYSARGLEDDLLRIQAKYRDLGYIEATVGPPEVKFQKNQTQAVITIPIQEGPRYKVGTVDFAGDLMEDREKLKKKAALKKGEWFSATSLSEDLKELGAELKDLGYAYADVIPETKIDQKGHVVDVVYRMQKGERVRFGRITFRGNKRTADRVLRRELKIAEGELFSQTNLDRSKVALTRLGFFESVNLATTPGDSPDRIDVVVEVKERRTGNIQVGAGYSALDSIVGNVAITEQNLFGRGQSLQLQGQLSRSRQLLDLRFIEPRLFGSRVYFSTDIFLSNQPIQGATRQSQGGRLTFGYNFTDEIRASVGYNLENVDIGVGSELIDSLPPELKEFGLISSVSGSGAYDSRDDRLFPTKGWFLGAIGEVADNATGSQLEFLRGSLSAARYFTLREGGVPNGKGIVLKLFGRTSGILPTNNEQNVPYTERYFLGGINSVRGLPILSVGPRIIVDGEEIVIGGTSEVLLSAEVEFPVFRDLGIRGVVFADAGNAYGTLNAPGLEVLPPEGDFGLPFRTSVGFGFRWYTPISPAPFRFEFGIPLQPKPGEKPILFQFSFGSIF